LREPNKETVKRSLISVWHFLWVWHRLGFSLDWGNT